MPAVNTSTADIEAATSAIPTSAVPAHTTTVRLNRRRRRRRQRPSATASSETTTDGSFRFSDTEDDSRSHDESSFSTEAEGISVISDAQRHNSNRRGGSSCTFSDDEEKEVDLESGELEMKVLRKRERRRECRICHLSLSVMGNGNGNSSDRRIIELGCCCKGDLGSAHKQCAENWFKIRGNTTCEICGATATNIDGEQLTEANIAPATSIAPPAAPPPVLPEPQSFCHGRRVMNFLLACMIFAFIISWLFHFKILP